MWLETWGEGYVISGNARSTRRPLSPPLPFWRSQAALGSDFMFQTLCEWWGILPLWQCIQQLPGLYVSSSWQNSVSTDWEVHCSPAFLCGEVNYLFLWPGSMDPADRARVRKRAGLHSRIRGLDGSIWNGILAQPPEPMESFSTICIPNSNIYFLFQLEVKIKFLNWLDMYGRLNQGRAVKLVTLASLQLLRALYRVRFTSAVSFFF